MAIISRARKLQITNEAFDLADGFHSAFSHPWEDWFGVSSPPGLKVLPSIAVEFFEHCCLQAGLVAQGIVLTRGIPVSRPWIDPVLSWLRPVSLRNGNPLIELDQKTIDGALNYGTLSQQSYPRCHAYACNCVVLHEIGHLVMHYHKILAGAVATGSPYHSLDPVDDAEAWCFASTVLGFAIAERAYGQKSAPAVPQLTPFSALVNSR